MTWFDPGYSFIHTAPPWGEMGWESCGVSINVLPPGVKPLEAPSSPGGAPGPRPGARVRGGVMLGLPPGRWLTSSGPRVEVTQGVPPGVGPGVCPVPLPLRTSDAGLCGHSASFPHGVVASRADRSPEEGPRCLLLVVGSGCSGEGFLEEIPGLEA